MQLFLDNGDEHYDLGGSQRGWQGLIPEDLEPLDALRGSNSAAYGANAFLGVVNIAIQSLPTDFDPPLSHSATTPMTWNAPADRLLAQHRTDVRLAKRFLIGPTRAEAALTRQAAGGDCRQFFPDRVFNRRAFVTLRPKY